MLLPRSRKMAVLRNSIINALAAGRLEWHNSAVAMNACIFAVGKLVAEPLFMSD